MGATLDQKTLVVGIPAGALLLRSALSQSCGTALLLLSISLPTLCSTACNRRAGHQLIVSN